MCHCQGGGCPCEAWDPRARPDGWDSNAFCTNLYFARKGLKLGFDSSADLICQAFNPPQVGTRTPNRATRKSVQSHFYDTLMGLEVCDWPQTIQNKIRPWVRDLPAGWHLTNRDCDALRATLSKEKVTSCMCILKSIANVWTTSSRMHDDVRICCVLGCDDSDSLAHYTSCETLWTIVTSCAGSRTSWLHCSPLERLCLVDPDHVKVRLLTIAFHCYHSLKLGNRELIDSAIASGDYSHCIDRLWFTAAAYSEDFG